MKGGHTVHTEVSLLLWLCWLFFAERWKVSGGDIQLNKHVWLLLWPALSTCVDVCHAHRSRLCIASLHSMHTRSKGCCTCCGAVWLRCSQVSRCVLQHAVLLVPAHCRHIKQSQSAVAAPLLQTNASAADMLSQLASLPACRCSWGWWLRLGVAVHACTWQGLAVV